MRCFFPGRSLGLAVAASVGALLLGGCSLAPSINVLGAYFPDWLFCIVAGVILTVIAYALLQRSRYCGRIGSVAVVYPALATLLSLVVWLLFFQH